MAPSNRRFYLSLERTRQSFASRCIATTLYIFYEVARFCFPFSNKSTSRNIAFISKWKLVNEAWKCTFWLLIRQLTLSLFVGDYRSPNRLYNFLLIFKILILILQFFVLLFFIFFFIFALYFSAFYVLSQSFLELQFPIFVSTFLPHLLLEWLLIICMFIQSFKSSFL